MKEYKYPLEQSIFEDYVDKQGENLIEEGYEYNEEEKTYDLYEEKYIDVTYVDFYYYEETEVKSQLSEYEVYRKTKVVNVKYKILKKEKGFLGFFKNVFNGFISNTEGDVSETRLQELELLLARGQIKDLQKTESFNFVSKIEKLTENEVKELQKQGIKYSFLRLLDEFITEKVLVKNKLTKIKKEEYIKDYEPHYETEIIKEYIEEELKEKLVLERRIDMEITMNIYIPGFWSYNGAHEFGSKADFSCQVNIKFISGFNPLDRDYFDYEEVKEKVIKIAEEEHPNTQFIRKRGDGLDGFNIEKSHID